MGDIALADGIPLSEDDIHQITRNELQNLDGDYSDQLRENWTRAYGYYRGDPRGDEQAGRSKIQSSDVADAVEWVLPVILKAFVESPDVVRFDADGPEDENQANMESDYVHHAFMKKCNGFQVLYEFIKDELLLKNGVTFQDWNEEVKQTAEPFQDLLEEELTMLLNPLDGSEVVLEETEVEERPATDPLTGEPLTSPQTGAPVLVKYHSGRIRRFTKAGAPFIEVCVPEKFAVNRDHYSINLDKARFCSYSMVKSAGELVASGYKAEKVEEVPSVEQTRTQWDQVRRARLDVELDSEGLTNPAMIAKADLSQRMVTVTKCCLFMDANGDGHEERYLVTLGGDDGEVMLGYHEVSFNPFDSASPFVAPHKFWGYSLYDKLSQIQDLKTKFIRMIADNTDLINDPEKLVVPGMMRMEDALVKRVSGIKRVDDLGAYQELTPPQVGPQAFSILEWADKMRGERVGVDPDAASVQKSFPDEAMNTAFERLMSAKEEVVALMIRVTAELWFAPAMLKFRKLIMTHMQREEMVKLRSKWVAVDPRNWTERTSTTIKVGLGTGDKLKKIMGYEKLIAMQAQEMAGGKEGYTVTDSMRVNTFKEFISASGLGDPDEAFLDPVKTDVEVAQMQQTGQAPTAEAYEAFTARQRQAQAQQAQAAQGAAGAAPGPDPQTLLQIEQMKGQTTLQVKQMDLQAKQMEIEARQADAQAKTQVQAQSDQLDAVLKRLEMMQDQQQFMMDNQRKWAELFEKSDVDDAQMVIKAREAATKAKAANRPAPNNSSGGEA